MSNIEDLATDVLSNIDSVPLPPVIKKSLFKSIARLITGVVDWPAAYLNAKAQQINSKADALSLITKAASEAAAKEFKTDPFLVDRTVEHFGARLLGSQINREKTVRLAIEDLKSDPPKKDVEKEIDTDWLDMFSRISETKSNEDVQLFLSKILAGEIKNPGTFSQRTIHTLSILDQKTAQIFQVFCNLSFEFIGTPGVESPELSFLVADTIGSPGSNGLAQFGLSYTNISLLQDAGLVQYSLDSTRPFGGGLFLVPFKVGDEILCFASVPGISTDSMKQVSNRVLNYTQTGTELKKVIHHSRDANYNAKFIQWVENKFKLVLVTRKA